MYAGVWSLQCQLARHHDRSGAPFGAMQPTWAALTQPPAGSDMSRASGSPCDHLHTDAGSQHSSRHAAVFIEDQRLPAAQSLCQHQTQQSPVAGADWQPPFAPASKEAFAGHPVPWKMSGTHVASLPRLCRPPICPQPPLCSAAAVLVELFRNFQPDCNLCQGSTAPACL